MVGHSPGPGWGRSERERREECYTFNLIIKGRERREGGMINQRRYNTFTIQYDRKKVHEHSQ